MLRRNTVLVAVALLLMWTLTACSGNGNDGAGNNESKSPPQKTDNVSQQDNQKENEKSKEVELTFWTISLSPTFDDYINGMVDEFQKQNPGVTVKWEDIPFDTVEKRTLTAAASGKLGDVMNLNTDYLKQLAAVGAVLDLTERAADVKDSYFEGVWDAGNLGDKTYALPWYLSNATLLYNKELLEKAGFDKPPATEKEAWEMSKVIKEKTGAFGNAWSDFHLYLPLNGVPLISDDWTKAAINTPEAVKVIADLKDFYDQGLLPKEILLGQAKHNEWFAQEKIAWWETGPQLFRQVEDLSPQVFGKSDAAPGILGSEGHEHVSIMNIAVSQKSKHPDEAVKLAKFITNGENQLAFSKIVSILPSVKSAAQDEFFTQGKDSDDPSVKGRYYAAMQLENSKNVFPPVRNISKINKVVNEEIKKVMLDNKDPQKAVEDAEAQINELLQE